MEDQALPHRVFATEGVFPMEDGFAFQMQRVPIPTLYLCFLVGYKCGEGLPLGMGVGIFRSNIILAGGLEAVYDGYTNFPPNPRKDVYQFDSKNSTYPIPFLQQGKSCPFLAEHNGKLYVLSTFSLKFSAGHHFTPSFEMFDPKEGKWAVCLNPHLSPATTLNMILLLLMQL